ncbi:MAG: 2Fe-2S iron-sulfur cluster binding domain-containing protein [Alphaproteobacteria bacterium]|nr:2Fe-2S iron-sulfur cluster binding domain-containing protein [Alphaproteobacteria bacterium]
MSASPTSKTFVSPKNRKKWGIPVTKRRLRLGSGLILFAFVVTHLANHALGLISLEAMEAGREYFLMLWRNPVGTALFVGSLMVHAAFALHAVYSRRRLRMSIGEALQLILGFAAPILLVSHVLGTRAAMQIYGTEDTYAYVLLALWVDNPMGGLKQSAATVIVWVHACIGLYYWLRLKPWFMRILPWLYGMALLIPVLGLLGFVFAGGAVGRLAAQDPGFRLDLAIDNNAPEAAQIAYLYQLESWIFMGMGAAIALTLLARALRLYLESREGVVRITYPEGRIVSVSPGMTILEASQLNEIPHAAVCGGRGRCSTCRVRVNGTIENLPEPDDSEQKVLRRVGAAPDVRLACQTRPTEDLSVTPLLPPNASPRDGFAKSAAMQGQEQEISILFADIRGFTSFSEQKLPYDVVFVLNRYFRSMGEAIEQAGGRVDKFIGDGIMALFGVDGNPRDGAISALKAAQGMAVKLDELNALLKDDLPAPLRIGIGIHAGAAIVGEMGYSHAISVTAIGDTVNTSSRLEAKTKDFGAQLIVSEHVAELGGLDSSALRHEEIEVRGRKEPMQIIVMDDAKDLLDLTDTKVSP